MDNDVTYEIKKYFGALDERRGKWRKEINLVSWNKGQDKFDIRSWDETYEHMTRGITLTEIETKNLYEILKSVFESESEV